MVCAPSVATDRNCSDFSLRGYGPTEVGMNIDEQMMNGRNFESRRNDSHVPHTGIQVLTLKLTITMHVQEFPVLNIDSRLQLKEPSPIVPLVSSWPTPCRSSRLVNGAFHQAHQDTDIHRHTGNQVTVQPFAAACPSLAVFATAPNSAGSMKPKSR